MIAKPPFTAAEFIRRAREAGADSLGLVGDLESTIALANAARLVDPEVARLLDEEVARCKGGVTFVEADPARDEKD